MEYYFQPICRFSHCFKTKIDAITYIILIINIFFTKHSSAKTYFSGIGPKHHNPKGTREQKKFYLASQFYVCLLMLIISPEVLIEESSCFKPLSSEIWVPSPGLSPWNKEADQWLMQKHIGYTPPRAFHSPNLKANHSEKVSTSRNVGNQCLNCKVQK